jgi:hypothetical protein
MSMIAEFNQRLVDEWLIPFCTTRGYSIDGYDNRGIAKIFESDACDFLQSIDHGLVTHLGGVFTAPRSRAKEQIFWEGAKKEVPRKITLWLEPIITIGALRRLQRDFGWSGDLLGLQSANWAFDLVAYHPFKTNTEYLMCEVKKSTREIDSLIRLMQTHLNSSSEIEGSLKGAERNAFKKVLSLRASRSHVFWALGPNGYEYVFKIIREPGNSVRLELSTDTALLASNNALRDHSSSAG